MRTVQAALDIVRRRRRRRRPVAETQSGSARTHAYARQEIVLSAGVHYFNQTLTVGPRDSNLTIRAVATPRSEAERPWISGGVPLRGLKWREHTREHLVSNAARAEDGTATQGLSNLGEWASVSGWAPNMPVQVAWGPNYATHATFIPETDIFRSSSGTGNAILIPLRDFVTNDPRLRSWVSRDSAVFCIARAGGANMDTAWALKNSSDQNTEWGCSGSNWEGRGAFYAGNRYGGGFVGAKDNGEVKAAATNGGWKPAANLGVRFSVAGAVPTVPVSTQRVECLVADVSAQLASGAWPATEGWSTLHVNGRRATRARFPNGDVERHVEGMVDASPEYATAAYYQEPYGGDGDGYSGPPSTYVNISEPARLDHYSQFWQMGIGPEGGFTGGHTPSVSVFNPPQAFYGSRNPKAGGPEFSQYHLPPGLVYGEGKLFSPRVQNWTQADKAVVHMFTPHQFALWQFRVAGINASNQTILFGHGGMQEQRGVQPLRLLLISYQCYHTRHVILIESRQALISYQYHHIYIVAGCEESCGKDFHGSANSKQFYVENILEELDAPNEVRI